MPLFDLANETLLEIIKETSADDITALASCCKQLHFLAQERLAFHRQNRDNANTVVVGGDQLQLPPSAIHPSKYLQDILEHDDTRFYTKVMVIRPFSHGDSEEERSYCMQAKEAKIALVANIRSRYECQISAIIVKVYSALLPYAAETKVEEWIDNVKLGDPAAVLILLLALYPNLKTLDIGEPSQKCYLERGNLFRALINTARNPATNKLRIFSRLSDFQLDGWLDARCLHANALWLNPFMILPTMRKIHGCFVNGRNIRWSFGTGASEVTAFYLQGDIDTTSTLDYIRGIKALGSFKYRFFFKYKSSGPVDLAIDFPREHLVNRLKWGPHANDDAANDDPDVEDSDEESSSEYDSDSDMANQPKWEPRAITAALLQYARNSLVSLKLVAKELKGAVKFSSDEPFIGSLRSFQVLQHVCIDIMMLFKKVKCSSNESRLHGQLAQQTSWEEIRTHELVEFLPMSVKSIKLTSVYVGRGLSKKDVEVLFSGLPELRYMLPNLLKVKVKWQEDRQTTIEEEGREELRLRCKESNILFVDEMVDPV